MDKFIGWCAGIILAAPVAAFLLNTFAPKDDTDPPNGRSQMELRIDARTGCHYLTRGFGGLTPRLDQDGNQICEQTTETAKE